MWPTDQAGRGHQRPPYAPSLCEQTNCAPETSHPTPARAGQAGARSSWQRTDIIAASAITNGVSTVEAAICLLFPFVVVVRQPGEDCDGDPGAERPRADRAVSGAPTLLSGSRQSSCSERRPSVETTDVVVALVVAVLAILAVGAPAAAVVTVRRAEINNGQRRPNGTAPANRDITIDGIVMGRSGSDGC